MQKRGVTKLGRQSSVSTNVALLKMIVNIQQCNFVFIFRLKFKKIRINVTVIDMFHVL